MSMETLGWNSDCTTTGLHQNKPLSTIIIINIIMTTIMKKSSSPEYHDQNIISRKVQKNANGNILQFDFKFKFYT